MGVAVNVRIDERIAILEAAVAKIKRTGQTAVDRRPIDVFTGIHKTLMTRLQCLREISTSGLNRIGTRWRWWQQ